MRRFLAAILMVGVGTASACAATWRVEQDGSGQFTTLQPAVDAAASGDTILIGPGWYQELHWVDHFGSPIQVAAYWLGDKDLAFIGAGQDQVTVGPSSYSQYHDGPQGLSDEGGADQTIYVSNMSFTNLYAGIASYNVVAADCRFIDCDTGISAAGGTYSSVVGCTFTNVFESSCMFFNCTTARVEGCELGGYVYFGSTPGGEIRSCTATGKALCHYYQSAGTVDGNQTDCYTGTLSIPCISVDGGSTVVVANNVIRGGRTGITVADQGTFVTMQGNLLEGHDLHNVQLQLGAQLVAHGNDFHKAPRSDCNLVQCYYYDGSQPLRIDMENNFWGYAYAGLIDNYIWDYKDDPSLMVEVDYDPFAGGSVPSEDESWGSVKALYLGR